MNNYEQSLELWNQNEYEAALDIWKLCLEQGTQVEEITNNIYEAFLIPNEGEFAATIVRARKKLRGDSITMEQAAELFQSYSVYYLPYSEKKYYVYHAKEKLLLGKVDFGQRLPENEDLFSDILIVNPMGGWDILENIAGRECVNIYCIGEAKKEYESVYCIPEVVDILEKEIIYFADCQEEKEYFLNHSSEYIPKNIRGNADAGMQQEIMNVFAELHEKRKTVSYRSTDHVLLTIGIPSYNRGARALENVKYLLNTVYDAEIEIVLSDNGSEKQKEQYEEIAKLRDARLKYYRASENQGFRGNILKIFELASGKFILFCSDEDWVMLNNLKFFLQILRTQKKLGILRGSLCGGANAVKYCNVSKKAGEDAFFHVFLNNNYLSGNIYRCDEYTKQLILKLGNKYMKNQAFVFYPHEFIADQIARNYDVYDSAKELIYIGESVKEDNINLSEASRPLFSLEQRLEQHGGWCELLDEIDDIVVSLRVEAYVMVCFKLFYLVSFNHVYYEDCWEKVCRKMVECCAEEYDHIRFLNPEEKLYYQNYVIDKLCLLYEGYCKNPCFEIEYKKLYGETNSV